MCVCVLSILSVPVKFHKSYRKDSYISEILRFFFFLSPHFHFVCPAFLNRRTRMIWMACMRLLALFFAINDIYRIGFSLSGLAILHMHIYRLYSCISSHLSIHSSVHREKQESSKSNRKQISGSSISNKS